MLKLTKVVILVLIFSLFISGCVNSAGNKLPSASRSGFIMDTLLRVKAYGDNSDKAVNEVIDEMNRIESLMSASKDDSEISKINKNAGMKAIVVNSDTFEVIKRAKYYAQKTDGLFDPTIGPLVDLWGIGTDHSKVPTEKEIKQVLPLIDYHKLIINNEEKSIYLEQAGMKLDVGGIAKGFAADRAMEIFKKNDIKHGYIDIGGNVMVWGDKPDKNLWTVGIQDPRAPREELMALIDVKDTAIVTSGDYERFFIKDGIRYHHILNPQQGYPARTGLISVTIIADNSFDADALSTSVFLMGWDKGKKLVEELGYGVMVVTKDKKVYISENLQDRMKIIKKEYKYEKGR